MKHEDEFLDFICVAAPRSGTTWIAEALSQHPQIWIPGVKELNFFNEKFLSHIEFKYPYGLTYYRKQFASAPAEAIIGELTPTYYVDPQAATRIYKHFPAVKILIFLRNPADVIFSTYLKLQEYGLFEKSLEEAISNMHELLSLGYYYKFLKYYVELFPQENIYISIYEDFFKNPTEGCESLFNFLSVDPSFRPSILTKRINPRREVRWKSIVLFRHYLRLFINLKPLLPLKKIISCTGHLDRLSEKIIELNLKDGEKKSLNTELRKRIMEKFDSDILQLENLFRLNLDVWRNKI